ncbi:MAG: hypothetical protein WC476_08875 [Phycisphaerae bacterium]|jgi:hypothetical protein
MGLFAFNRARRLAAEQKAVVGPDEEAPSGLDEYRELKKKAKELGIEVQKGTKADGIKELIEKAGGINE